MTKKLSFSVGRKKLSVVLSKEFVKPAKCDVEVQTRRMHDAVQGSVMRLRLQKLATVVPKNRVAEVIGEIDRGTSGGHLVVAKTLEKVREYFGIFENNFNVLLMELHNRKRILKIACRFPYILLI